MPDSQKPNKWMLGRIGVENMKPSICEECDKELGDCGHCGKKLSSDQQTFCHDRGHSHMLCEGVE